jgi:alpha-galactosidase
MLASLPQKAECPSKWRRAGPGMIFSRVSAKWVKIYQDKMLSRGEYDGTLYDIGFDRPEAHVVRKDNKVYYGFFADSFDDTLELRGLETRAYEIIDYVNDRKLGEVKGPTAQIKTQFDGYLLLEAVPRP